MGAEAKGEFRLTAAEFDQSGIDFEGHVDIGPYLTKPVEPWDQPYRCQRRLDADTNHGLRRNRDQFRKQFVDAVETPDQLGKQPPACIRQFDAAVMAFEQGLVQEGFEFANLSADRRLRNEKFFGRAAEAQKTAGGFETPQCRQGKSTALHSHNLMLSEPEIILV